MLSRVILFLLVLSVVENYRKIISILKRSVHSCFVLATIVSLFLRFRWNSCLVKTFSGSSISRNDRKIERDIRYYINIHLFTDPRFVRLSLTDCLTRCSILFLIPLQRNCVPLLKRRGNSNFSFE